MAGWEKSVRTTAHRVEVPLNKFVRVIGMGQHCFGESQWCALYTERPYVSTNKARRCRREIDKQQLANEFLPMCPAIEE